MARILGRKQKKQEAEAGDRAATAEWLNAVMTATGDAALVRRPLLHGPAIDTTPPADEAPAPRSGRLVSSVAV